MLKWDTKTKTSTGKGILGTVQAFAHADDKQGRKNTPLTPGNFASHANALVKRIKKH
jgi:hypothetical protein